MKEELLKRALQSVMPKSRHLQSFRDQRQSSFTHPPEINRMHSGTTVLAFQYSKGVMFAADRKTSDGYMGILSMKSIKIHQLADHELIGCAGSVGEIQLIVKTMKEVNGGYSGQFGYSWSG